MKKTTKQGEDISTENKRSNFFNDASIQRWEFIILLGLTMGLSALCIDTVLPALSPMQEALQVKGENQMQYIISVLFLGLAVGQLFYGTLSDCFGRRWPMFAGFVLLFVGTVVAFFAQSLTVMLVGRFLQGFGLASPRTVSLAIVRDQFKGDQMAKVMSFVMAIFMLIPIIAPSTGQLIINVADWRIIFVVIAGVSLLLLVWFMLRMPETYPEEERMEFSGKAFLNSIKEVARHKDALAYMLMCGLMTGAFVGFLNCIQQVLQQQYDLGKQFALYMGGLSAFIGVASFVNGWLVKRFGMRSIVLVALGVVLMWSAVFTGGLLFGGWKLSLWASLAYLAGALFCTGFLFGNMNSLAMAPLGAVAGMASTLVGAATNLIGTGVGTLISLQYTDSILPIVVGYVCTALLGIGLVVWGKFYENRQKKYLKTMQLQHG
jgi:DHA1 family bicyclomycin/chloramphenicol resistance-like MFS transporter